MRVIFYVLGIILSASTSFADPRFWQYEFPETDFQKTSLESWLEIRSGGVGKDGIPALDHVDMIAVADANIPATEPVITLELVGQAPRAYPLRYMTWHEIVNDFVGDVPFTVTFCPLCNSAIVFDRRVQGQVLDFGVTGQLRNSDMVMYDRQTFTWWQQAVGQGIVGELMGVELTVFPSWMESFGDFQARNPTGVVMAEPKYSRPATTPIADMTATHVRFCLTVNFHPTVLNLWHVWCASEIAPGHLADFQMGSERLIRLVSP
jgi:hypothetical protein